jgi:glycosyltransferase involved in cell wall biosynthesis
MEHKQEKIISFCIPSYNRGDKLCTLIKTILSYQGDDIEVVVLDNCSTDQTVEQLKQIKDDRFRLFHNESNIGFLRNLLTVPTLAVARYAVLCLDKDFVDVTKVGELVDILRNETDVAVGYCNLISEWAHHASSQQKEEPRFTVYQKGEHAVFNAGYLSGHPTGKFYRTNVYKKLPALKEALTDDTLFAFWPDVIDANMAMEGNALKISISIFSMETRVDSKKVLSHSFREKNLYFYPDYVKKTYANYLASLGALNLMPDSKKRLAATLFERGFYASTFNYQIFMRDEDLCAHYQLKPRQVSLPELIFNGFGFSKAFLKVSTPPLTFVDKLTIILSVYWRLVRRLVKKRLKFLNS